MKIFAPKSATSSSALYTVLMALLITGSLGVLPANTLLLEAEDYSAMSGIQLENDGSTVGFFDDGDWLRYDAVDFGTGFASIEFTVAKMGFGGRVEIRTESLTGPIIGTLEPTATTSWVDFQPQAVNIEVISGIQDLFLIATGAQGVCNFDFFELSTEPIAEPNWVLMWADEFNGSDVDENYWSKIDHGNPDNGELQFYTPREKNIVVSDGTLKLIARRETYTGQGPWMPEPVTRQYTSGKIETLGKISFQYGRIEASMKLPRGRGTWPAFWMLGDNIFEPGIGWPRCGEIDIMEHGQDFDNLGAAIHTQAYNHTIGTQITGTYQIDDYDTDFHTYGLVWSPEELSFSVDGNTYLRITKEGIGDSEAEWPFDQSFFMILNHAVGGAWGGTPDDSLYPHTVEVDWVRVYEDQAITSTEELPEQVVSRIFPNPAQEQVNLELAASVRQAKAILYNQHGQQIQLLQVAAGQTEIDIRSLPPGIYLLTVSKDGQLIDTHRFIKS